MKKVGVVVGLILVVLGLVLVLPGGERGTVSEYDYLRIHIRANSNSAVDQNVKYQIKDDVVAYLTPYLSEVESKEEAVEIVEEHSSELEKMCVDKLKSLGFNYSANVKITNEYFPTRTYVNTTLESGYYDAVIVELGEAEGDNWWCVMYPPLCFVNNFENSMQINFKSKILEWFKSIFG